MLTGCRRNEILTLRWADVDLEAGEIQLRREDRCALRRALDGGERACLPVYRACRTILG